MELRLVRDDGRAMRAVVGNGEGPLLLLLPPLPPLLVPLTVAILLTAGTEELRLLKPPLVQ